VTQAEALRLVAMLSAAFRTELSDETGLLWARQLMNEDLGDGMEAVEVLSRTSAFMPSSPKLLLDMIRDVRVNRNRWALPEGQGWGISFGDWYRVQDEAMRERCRRMFPAVTSKLDRGEEATIG
jgi:hypothetical protein